MGNDVKWRACDDLDGQRRSADRTPRRTTMFDQLIAFDVPLFVALLPLTFVFGLCAAVIVGKAIDLADALPRQSPARAVKLELGKARTAVDRMRRVPSGA